MNISKEKLKRIILEEIQNVNEEEQVAQKCNQDPITQLNSVIKSLIPLHTYYLSTDDRVAKQIQQLNMQLKNQLIALKKIRDEYEVNAPTAARPDAPMEAPMKKREFGITQRM
jgi:hypothetical protein